MKKNIEINNKQTNEVVNSSNKKLDRVDCRLSPFFIIMSLFHWNYLSPAIDPVQQSVRVCPSRIAP